MSKVLIVDDEKSIRTTLCEILRASDYEIEVAVDAATALELLSRMEFDVVLSDIVLPCINGIELLKRIRETAPFAQVIMMTGEPSIDNAAEALRAGAFDFLTKPAGKNAVLRAVDNAMKIKTVNDDRRRLEEENRLYRDELERLVQTRTSELQNAMEHLKNAQSELVRHERLNALAQLAAGICHDFNNVLMPIRGLADYLVSNPETLDDREETMKLLRSIHTATGDAKEIVRRMREFYSPREAADVRPLSTVELFNDVVELTRAKWETQAQGEGRRVQVVCNAIDIPGAVGNASQLREALTNLVLNAVDAMPEGGVITLSARHDGDTVVMSVEDTGDGMPEAVRKRCLEPLFSTKGEHGTGMGLAMVHGIAMRHNGRLDIESVPSKGTTVRMHLPLAVGKRLGRSSAEDRALPPVCADRSRQILVIDDEEWSRSLTAKYLRGAGYSVELASSGAVGLETAARKVFDLVITDRTMPGMNGDQVASALKRTMPHTPVLLLTGDIMRECDGMPADVDAVLEKPVTQREVVAAVGALTATQGGRMRE